MRTLNILHISDAHIQKSYAPEIKDLVKKLIIDIKNVQKEKNILIDLICFTGDLIQRGDNALEGENQWELAMDILVNPILQELDLSSDRFIFAPGNHEVDTTKIIPMLEKGLKIESLQDIHDIMDNFHNSYNSRLSYFYEKIQKQLPDIKVHDLGYSYVTNINNINVGIACVDSAWRSSGKGPDERGNLYVGTKQIKDLYADIAESDIRICAVHHPLDWLSTHEVLDVEKNLAKYDFVLRGHVHNADLKQIVYRESKTIYNTAGKLYPLDFANGRAVDGYNGYSIINIEYDKSNCNIFFRTYYGANREEFDVGTNIYKEGEATYNLLSEASEASFKSAVIAGIKQYFYNMSEKYAIIKDIDAKYPKNISQILVDPVLSSKSEYMKEDEDDTKKICINNILEENDNIILIGKKETGKTTVLQQIGLKYIYEYKTHGLFPVYINMKYLPKGENRLLKSAIQFIQNNILDNEAISKQDIINLITSGQMVFLIDNVDINRNDHTKWIEKFNNAYKENRFIMTIEEEFFQSLDVKQIPNYGTDFKEIYIQYMGKRQIRDMVTKWAEGRNDIVNIDDIVNKIDSYCNQINFAKTPFNIAVFMVICDENSNFVPSNEGIVMQNYLEIILEKMSPQESLRNTYSFSLKQNFLSYIAYKMYLKNEYFLTKEEFENIITAYHTIKGYILSKSRFDNIFFEKNILSYSGDLIVFSHTSFLEYFLAVYAYDNEEFLNEITKKDNRIYFKNEICFYSGLNKNCTELIENLSVDILSTIMKNMELLDSLNNIKIMAEFTIDKDQFIDDIQNNRPTQNEIDIISEQFNQYNETAPVEIKKYKTEESSNEDFYYLLQIYGSVIKNAELLDNNYKIKHLEHYMYGMNMLYAMIINSFDYVRDDIKFGDLSEIQKADLNVNTEEDFENLKQQTIEFMKLILPIAIQNLILENVGTPKLEVAINQLIETKQNKPFENFMLTFLKCDLKIAHLKSLLSQYIKQENSKDILKIALVKLTFYYKSRFWGNNLVLDKELIDLITDIHMKINPQKKQNLYKSKIAQVIKSSLDNAK